MKWIVAFFAIIFCASVGAAELAPVAPATDWTGVAVVSVLGLIFVAIAAYIVHIKRTPGQQLGEAELEWVAQRLHILGQSKGVVITTTDPLFFDGIQFKSQTDLDNYKAAKATIDNYRKETP